MRHYYIITRASHPLAVFRTREEAIAKRHELEETPGPPIMIEEARVTTAPIAANIGGVLGYLTLFAVLLGLWKLISLLL